MHSQSRNTMQRKASVVLQLNVPVWLPRYCLEVSLTAGRKEQREEACAPQVRTTRKSTPHKRSNLIAKSLYPHGTTCKDTREAEKVLSRRQSRRLGKRAGFQLPRDLKQLLEYWCLYLIFYHGSISFTQSNCWCCNNCESDHPTKIQHRYEHLKGQNIESRKTLPCDK